MYAKNKMDAVLIEIPFLEPKPQNLNLVSWTQTLIIKP